MPQISEDGAARATRNGPHPAPGPGAGTASATAPLGRFWASAGTGRHCAGAGPASFQPLLPPPRVPARKRRPPAPPSQRLRPAQRGSRHLPPPRPDSAAGSPAQPRRGGRQHRCPLGNGLRSASGESGSGPRAAGGTLGRGRGRLRDAKAGLWAGPRAAGRGAGLWAGPRATWACGRGQGERGGRACGWGQGRLGGGGLVGGAKADLGLWAGQKATWLRRGRACGRGKGGRAGWPEERGGEVVGGEGGRHRDLESATGGLGGWEGAGRCPRC